MIRSMTGYGKTSKVIGSKKVSVEIKSLNSKNFNPFIKIPEEYYDKEIEIKNILFNKLAGGKINFTLQIESEETSNTKINKTVFSHYLDQLKEIANEQGIDLNKEQVVHSILRLPDVLSQKDKAVDEEEWKLIIELINEVILRIEEFKLQEGKALEIDIAEKIRNIEKLIPEIEPFENERLESVKNRLDKKLNGYLNSIDEQANDRFEQEIIYYLDKFDINEEKTRLINHCKYFFETIETNEPVGTKLGFIAQEIGREINTIGSKANHSDIQKIVVVMKDNLGKVKEQLLNVL